MTGSELRFETRCSKGTYVRTLAEDLAVALGTVGHVARLRRLALGPFQSPRMHTMAELERDQEPQALEARLLPVDSALTALPAVRLGQEEQACILHGQAVFTAGPAGSQVRMYGADGGFLGVGRMSGEGRQLAPERIMIERGGQPAASA